MSSLVTRTKVILPQRRKELLSRSRLIHQLNDLLDYKLILVIAPAGYGKTALLLDFAHQTDLPTCWYSIDNLDQDFQRFLEHFAAAIKQRFPEFGGEALNAIETTSQPDLNINRLVSAMVNDAYEHIREHFLIVLDDYHLVNGQKEIQTFINRFITEVAENCHLVLSSRALLSLPDMPLFVARAQVGGIGFEDLAFRTEEIRSLVFQNYRASISSQEAAQLVQETEGWITGVLLTTQSTWRGMAAQLQAARVSDVGLYDYLAQQVLKQQPRELQDFLLKTSFLGEFDASLCQAVFGDTQDWAGLIREALHNNLFILPVSEDESWIRYHHLFRDFLQVTYEREQPNKALDLRYTIAATYQAQKLWEKAFELYQDLGKAQEMAAVVEAAGSDLIAAMRLGTLLSWIEELPETLVEAMPTLLALKGSALVNYGQVEKSLPFLNQAEAAFRLSGDWANLASVLSHRATAYRLLGKYQDALNDAREAIQLEEKKPTLRYILAEANRAMGMCLYHLGQLENAVSYWQRSLQTYQAFEYKQSTALVNMELGMCWMAMGSYRQALEHYEKALSYWRSVNNTSRLPYVLNNMGVMYHLIGDYLQSNRLFDDALVFARQAGMSRVEAYTLCSIGDLYVELGEEAAARDAYQQAQLIAQKVNDHYLMFYAYLVEAAQARRLGELKRSNDLLQTCLTMACEDQSDFELGQWHLEAGLTNLAETSVPDAIEQLQEAVRLFELGGQKIEAARASLYLANAYHRLPDQSSALEALEKAFQLVSTLDSQHILVASGREARLFLQQAAKDARLGSQAAALYSQIVRFEENLPKIRRDIRPRALSALFAPPKVSIHALGHMKVELDGKPITIPEWTNQKAVRETFFYLLARPSGATREEMGEILWPESDPEKLRIQFKNVLYRIRYTVGTETILLDRNRYAFNRAIDYYYDVEAFEEKLRQAEMNKHPGMKKELLQAALALYGGPFLPEGSGSWLMPERQRLRKQFIQAALSLAQVNLEEGNTKAAILVLDRALDEDPCSEEAHRLMMRVYAAQGNRAAIVLQYEACCKALKDIGAEPSEQTTALFRTLTR
jgi:ATP/maltotriose-dependent transcriptional regulator MalT/DNA-binding SARP family transcriptional activator